MSILKSILNDVWALDPNAAMSYLPQILKLISGDSIQIKRDPVDPVSLYSTSGIVSSGESSGESAPVKQVAVFSIRDIMLKNDTECGPIGMETMNRRIKNILAREEIVGMVLDIDSPGGQANYMPILAATIAASEKPIVAYYNSLCASAAYGVASHAKEIYASTENDVVGSVGTFITILDYSKMLKAAGIDVHEIYADKSTKKNEMFRQVLAGEYKPIKTELLNPTNESFINSVKAHRQITDPDAYAGKTFMAKEAISNGMIDGIKTFEECVSRVFELAEEATQSPANNPQTNNHNSMKQQIQTVAAFLGYSALESKDGHISLSEADVAKLGATLGLLTPKAIEGNEESDDAPVLKALGTLTSTMTQLADSVKSMSEQNATIVGRLDVVEGKAGAKPATTALPKNQGDEDDSPKASYEDPANPLNVKIQAELNGGSL